MIGMALALAFSSTQKAAPLSDRASITQCDEPNAEQTATFERRRANIRKSGVFFDERLWICPED